MKILKTKRKKQLRANFTKIFWIRALMNVKIINIVMSLFLVTHGLTLSQVLYLGFFWSLANLLFEIPSSFMADIWGRKKTIILAIFFGLLYWIFYLLGTSYFHFILGTFMYAISVSFFSGTEDALLYDSAKELGQEADTLGKLGKSLSARHLIKIIAPIVGVLIARGMTEYQFDILLWIDIVVTLCAAVLAFSLTEARHHMDLEKMEAGVLWDAVNIFKKNAYLRNAVFNRVLVFVGFLVMWHYYQTFFVELGVSLVWLGILFGFVHLILYIFYARVSVHVQTHNIEKTIHIFNILAASSLVCFFVLWWLWPEPYALYLFFIAFTIFEGARLPLFLELYNKQSNSYNRATTLSLAGFVKSALEMPMALLAGYLITVDIIAPYLLSLFLTLIAIIFFRITPDKMLTRAKK